MDLKKTGALIAKARKEKGLTQQQLAEQLHVSHTTVSKWERGLGFPEVSLLEPLAAALGLTLEDLFTGEEPPAENQPKEANRPSSGMVIFLLLAVVVFCALAGWSGRMNQTYGGDPSTIRGCWQHVPEQKDAERYLVTLSADLIEPTYQLYINERLVDEGTWTEGENRTFFLDGELLDFTAELTFEKKQYAQFILHLPGLEQPLHMRKRGDFNLATPQDQYNDQDEYKKLLSEQ